MLKRFLKWFFDDDPVTKSLKNLNKDLGLPEDFGILTTKEIVHVAISGQMPRKEDKYYDVKEMDRS